VLHENPEKRSMAKRHPASRRRPADHSSEPDDVFVAKVVELSTWSKRHSQALILMGVALAVLVVGTVYYVNYRERVALAAVQELEVIQQNLTLADPAATELRLAQYLERFGSTPYGGEARMLLAQMYLQRGESALAVLTLEEGAVGLGEPIGPQMAVLLARAYEAQNRFGEAEDLYLRVADGAELEFQRVEALLDAARIRLELGNAAGAAELYEELLEGSELSDPDRGLYEMRLAEARTRAAGG
jgi:predicted negative regulator of RcsB-dependent stress response